VTDPAAPAPDPVLCLPGTHDYTDTLDHDGWPVVLYCRKCADVQPLLVETPDEATS
jgi:hypothetical protein